MKKNHWGISVDSEKPITGVINNNSMDIEYLGYEIGKGINLTYETFIKENPDFDSDTEEYYGDSDTYLIGDWLKIEGLYLPDTTAEYSAIVRESTTQVVFSVKSKRVALCSPCYPGQGDLGSKGDFLAYNIPW